MQGNYIGTDITGTLDFGTNQPGIILQYAGANTIGGVYPGAGNLIKNNAIGIKVENSTNVTILSNRIENNDRGIDLIGASTVAANSMNCISGNTASGMSNTTGTLTSAMGNWWGAANGPSGSGSGHGDSVSTNVTFTPWDTTSCTSALNQQVLNGSFEIDTNSDFLPDSWTQKFLQLGSDGRNCASAAVGPCSVVMQGNGTEKILSQTINRSGIAGDDINASLYAQATSVPGGGSFKMVVTVTYFDATTASVTVNLPTGLSGWTQYSAPVLVATKNYTKISVQLFYNKASGSARFDGVSLKVSP